MKLKTFVRCMSLMLPLSGEVATHAEQTQASQNQPQKPHLSHTPITHIQSSSPFSVLAKAFAQGKSVTLDEFAPLCAKDGVYVDSHIHIAQFVNQGSTSFQEQEGMFVCRIEQDVIVQAEKPAVGPLDQKTEEQTEHRILLVSFSRFQDGKPQNVRNEIQLLGKAFITPKTGKNSFAFDMNTIHDSAAFYTESEEARKFGDSYIIKTSVRDVAANRSEIQYSYEWVQP